MIFDGRNGYVKGDMDQAADTVLAMIRGPVAMSNWHNTTNDPTYAIVITAGAAGTVALQGTNDVVYSSNDDSRNSVSKDFNPPFDAVWTDIQAATAVSVSGTFSTEYRFLRLVIVDQGVGTVLTAWVNWN